jgi:hypothetical protein
VLSAETITIAGTGDSQHLLRRLADAFLQSHPEDEILTELKGQLPFPEVMLKSWEDHLRYLQTTPKGDE